MKKPIPIQTLVITALLLAALILPFLRPAAAQPLALIVVILGILTTVIQAIIWHYRQYVNIHRNPWKLARNTAVDILGILLAVGTAILLGTAAARQVIAPASAAFESLWAGIGSAAGTVAGLAAALVAGSGAGFVIRWIWVKMTVKLDQQSPEGNHVLARPLGLPE
jgi:hypothetical protein